MEPPPGGPEDKAPPEVIAVRPDTAALVGPGTRPVVIVFNERISEKGLEDSDPRSVIVSPRTSPVRVERSRDELRVELRRGWEPGRIYHVTVLPVVQDLFNNRITEPVKLVFSTGPPIPATRLRARVTDRVTGRPVLGARVEAILSEDSLVYALLTDSAGTAEFARIPVGLYRVRAFQDVNNNRALDVFEARDTARAGLSAGDSASVRFALVLPDSTPPDAVSAELANGILEVKFDDFLDPEQTVAAAQVEVLSPSGAAVSVQRASIGPLPPAADSAPAPRDTLTRPDSAASATARSAPLPHRSVFVQLRGELLPDTIYEVRVRGVRNVVGRVGGGQARFRAPAAPVRPPTPAEPARSRAAPPPNSLLNPAPAPAPRPGNTNTNREPL